MKRIKTLPLFCVMMMALLTCFVTQARDKEEDRVIVTLKDGTVIDGYLKSEIMSDKVKVKDKVTHKTQKISTEDMEKLVFPPTEKDTSTAEYRPVMVYDYVISALESKKVKHPRLLMKVFETDKMIGYISPTTDFTFTGTWHTTYVGVPKYYYYVKGDQRAYAYWYEVKGITTGLKGHLKKFFSRFPSVVEFIDSDEFSSKEFKKHPEMMMLLVAESLEKEQCGPEKDGL